MPIDASSDGFEHFRQPIDRTPPRPARLPSRKSGVDLRLSLVDGAPMLPWRWNPSALGRERTPHEVLQAARALDGRPGAFLIGGGEPLRRSDLWELLAELARLRPTDLGICTFGHAVNTELVPRLHAAGVQRLQVPFHCARQDAHDWLVGQAGALKMALRAIRASLEAQLPVTADVVLTRPTTPHLAETIEVLARVGVRRVCVRRLAAGDTDGTAFVPLSPRLSLLESCLEQAATVALERRVHLSLRDFPLCVAPRLRSLFASPESEGWVLPDGTVTTRAEAGIGCPGCPGLPQCVGAPQDYVSRFGWEEFADHRGAPLRLQESAEDQRTGPSSSALIFSWSGRRRVRCEACADPPAEFGRTQQRHESTRCIRARLVEAARYRPSVLRLVGADLLAHPQSAPLIYDAVRLFRRVEVAGEASPVVDWSDLDLRRMKDVARIDVALYGPDAATHDAHCGIPGAFAAMQRGVQRLCADTQIPVGAYAILHDARWVPAFAEAWDCGRLPGVPRFRLSARGSSLEELVQCAQALPPGPARAALLAVLPRCLCEQRGLDAASDGGYVPFEGYDAPQLRIHCGRGVPYQPCGSDPIGAFAPCGEGGEPCSFSDCVGTAVGWRSTARSNQWQMSR